MHWSPVLLLTACAGLAAAHGGDGGDFPVPKLVGGGGRKLMSEILADRRTAPGPGFNPRAAAAMGDSSAAQRRHHGQHKVPPLGVRKRQRGGRDGQCGPGYGNCARGFCCSSEGWCGIDADYCSAPDCQLTYGSGCDGNQKPEGVDTSDVPRPKLGSVMYGGLGVYNCQKRGDIAITFDDGPYNFTGDLLDKFAAYGAKGTFFITGNNIGKGMINDYSKPWAGFIKRMIAEGHQVASHTWSHQNASQMSDQQLRNQIVWNEIAFNDILGFFPTYYRPPFSICEKKCQNLLAQLGYHIIYFDLDTEGYLHDSPQEIQTSKDIWSDTIDRSNPAAQDFLMIEHDIHYETVYNLTDYVLTGLFAKGYRSVTVGECLGDPPANWYRAGSGKLPGPTTPTVPQPTRTTKKPPSSVPTTSRSRIPSTTILPPGRPTTLIPDQPITRRPPPRRSAAAEEPAPTLAASAVMREDPAPAASPTGGLKVSDDSRCGAGVTCEGSRFGNCCSAAGYCGFTMEYCGDGCQSPSGRCGTDAVAVNPVPPGTSMGVSLDGACGAGSTCLGSAFGNCCSNHGWCGRTADYCGKGCQATWGACSDSPRGGAVDIGGLLGR